MKTRENELHEPKIIPYHEGLRYFAIAYCSVCEATLSGGFFRITEEDAIEDVRDIVFNYCPNCGARLKEVGE